MFTNTFRLPSRVSLPIVVGAAVILGLSASAKAQTANTVATTPPPPPPAPTVAISPSAGTFTVKPGQVFTIALNAWVNNPPQSTSECQITGPAWTWSGGPTVTGSGTNATLSWSAPNTPGSFTVSVGATATYTSSCGGGPAPSGTATFTITVSNC